MSNEEIKLIEVLIEHGDPTNICIANGLLTFDLKEPKGGCNSMAVMEVQRSVLKAFPSYCLVEKMVNDEKHFWSVLKQKY